MSLYGALRSGVSSLFANSQRMAMIADNIANVNTVGYKRVDARFSSFVTQSSRRGLYNSGGVVSQTERENSQQGILEPTSFSTDIAITGRGFFVVTDSVQRNQDGKYINSGNVAFTRAGQFRRDSNGNLLNAEGQYLLSWAPDATNVNREEQSRFIQTNDISQFEVVNIEQQALDPIQTSRVDLGVNLAAEAGAGSGNSFSVEVPIVDPQGISRGLIFEFIKPTAITAGAVTTTAVPNTWIMYASFGNEAGDPQLFPRAPATPPVRAGTVSTADRRVILGAVTFDANGRLSNVDHTIDTGEYAVDSVDVVSAAIANRILTTVASEAESGINLATATQATSISAAGVTTGAPTGRFYLNVDFVPNNAIATADRRPLYINLGTVAATGTNAGSDGFTQFGSGGDLSVIKFVEQNGRLFSGIDSVSITSGGIVEGFYSNGETRNLYQVPLFTFANPNGLRTLSGNLFAQTADSGLGVARISGTQGAGTLIGSAVESSTTDIAAEFSNMIITQRAYSAATRVITTTDEMLQELSNTVR